MFREELVYVTLNDACFAGSKFTNDENLKQVLLTISSSTARCLKVQLLIHSASQPFTLRKYSVKIILTVPKNLLYFEAIISSNFQSEKF